jgi:hypothetical protein
MSNENLIPIGRYTAKAVRVAVENVGEVYAQFQKAKTGNITMLVHFEVQEPEEWRGTVLPWFATFTDKTESRIVESLGYMGMQGDDLSRLNQEALDGEVQIVVEHEPREKTDERSGEVRSWKQARISFVNRAGRGVATFSQPLDDRDLAAFAAQMRGAIRGTRAGSGQRSGSARPPSGNGSRSGGGGHPNAPGSRYGGGAPDDDLPFSSCELESEPHPMAHWRRFR